MKTWTVKNQVKMVSGLCLMAAILTACGGGGGGGSDNNSTSSFSSVSSASSSSSSSASSEAPDENTAPLVDAGTDLSVSAGDLVMLEGEASDSDGEVVSRQWVQVSGPRVPLTVVDLNAGRFSFRAPNTGVDESVTLGFRYSATDDGGASSADTLAVTVGRINQSPVVQTSNLLVVDSAGKIDLTATAYDPDGSIVSFLWQQTGGQAVTISNADQKNASFMAPAAGEQQDFEFMLEVTDNEGVTSTDLLTIVVASENAPAITMDFPPAQGAYTGGSISAYGVVAAVDGANVQSVTVTAGVAPVTATLSEDGHWRADDIVLPDGVATIRITAEVRDSENRANFAGSELRAADNVSVGPGVAWGQTTAMVLSPDRRAAWVLAEGAVADDLRLMSIDLVTGFRSTAVTDFADNTQGSVASHYTDMAFDAASGTFYLSASEQFNEETNELETPASIYRVDAASGQREQITLVSDDAELNLIAPTGLFYHSDEKLYVADEGGQVIAIDPVTGATVQVADSETVEVGLIGPLQLAWDINLSRFIVMERGIGAIDMLGLTLGDPATTTMISEGESISFGPIPLESAAGLVIDQMDNRAFVLTSYANNITAVDLVTGERSILVEDVSQDIDTARDIVLDESRNIIYAVGGADYDQALYAIDPLSGSKVTISTSF